MYIYIGLIRHRASIMRLQRSCENVVYESSTISTKRYLSFSKHHLIKLSELATFEASHYYDLKIIDTKTSFKKSDMTAPNSNRNGYHGDMPLLDSYRPNYAADGRGRSDRLHPRSHQNSYRTSTAPVTEQSRHGTAAPSIPSPTPRGPVRQSSLGGIAIGLNQVQVGTPSPRNGTHMNLNDFQFLPDVHVGDIPAHSRFHAGGPARRDATQADRGRADSCPPPPPWMFNSKAMEKARSIPLKVGDVVSHDFIQQAWVNLHATKTTREAGEFSYAVKDVHYVASKAQENTQKPPQYRTSPAVCFGNRYGVISAIYDSHPGEPVKAEIVPEFTHSGGGLFKPGSEKARLGAYAAEHLGIMHSDDYRHIASSENPHPDAPLSAVLRLTKDSKHRPRQYSVLRFTEKTRVNIYDPRVVKIGELEPQSIDLFRKIDRKIGDMCRLDHTERHEIDVSEFPWLAYLNRYSELSRREQQADAPTQSSPRDDRGHTSRNAGSWTWSKDTGSSLPYGDPEPLGSIVKKRSRASDSSTDSDAHSSFDSSTTTSTPNTPPEVSEELIGKRARKLLRDVVIEASAAVWTHTCQQPTQCGCGFQTKRLKIEPAQSDDDDSELEEGEIREES